MDKNNINFIISGNDAESAAQQIQKIIIDEFNYTPHISSEKENKSEHQTKSAELISMGALIIAIPGAILAVSDIIERIQKKKKLDQTLEKIKKQVIQKREITVKINYPNGLTKEIDSTDSVEILEMITKEED